MAEPSPQTTKGGCICGSIRYEVTAPPKASILCYCPECRKLSGSAFVPVMIVDSTNFKLTGSGETHQYASKSYKDTEKVTNFCSECGSLLLWGIYGKDTTHSVYVGTLDSEYVGSFDPTFAIVTGKRPEWAKVKYELKEFEAMP